MNDKKYYTLHKIPANNGINNAFNRSSICMFWIVWWEPERPEKKTHKLWKHDFWHGFIIVYHIIYDKINITPKVWEKMMK